MNRRMTSRRHLTGGAQTRQKRRQERERARKGGTDLRVYCAPFFPLSLFFFHQLMKLFTLTAIATALFAVSDAAMTR